MFFSRRDLVFRLIKISSLFYKQLAHSRQMSCMCPVIVMVAREEKDKKDKSEEKM